MLRNGWFSISGTQLQKKKNITGINVIKLMTFHCNRWKDFLLKKLQKDEKLL